MAIYKFNHSSTFPIEALEGTLEKRIYDKLAIGEELTENESYSFMKKISDGISVPKGVMARGGWALDCRGFMNLYWIKVYDQIIERYAPNKTILRQHLVNWGYTNRSIVKIVLVEKASKEANNGN